MDSVSSRRRTHDSDVHCSSRATALILGADSLRIFAGGLRGTFVMCTRRRPVRLVGTIVVVALVVAAGPHSVKAKYMAPDLVNIPIERLTKNRSWSRKPNTGCNVQWRGLTRCLALRSTRLRSKKQEGEGAWWLDPNKVRLSSSRPITESLKQSSCTLQKQSSGTNAPSRRRRTSCPSCWDWLGALNSRAKNEKRSTNIVR